MSEGLGMESAAARLFRRRLHERIDQGIGDGGHLPPDFLDRVIAGAVEDIAHLLTPAQAVAARRIAAMSDQAILAMLADGTGG